MGRSLSHLSDEFTQETNTTGVLTPIGSIQASNATFLKFKNNTPRGKRQGMPLIMDLRDGSNNQLPTNTTLIFRVERPEDDEPTAVTVAEKNIAGWNQLTTSEQRNEDNIDSVKIELKRGSFNVRDHDTLTIDVNSSAAIDWSNSEMYFVQEAVEEHPLQS